MKLTQIQTSLPERISAALTSTTITSSALSDLLDEVTGAVPAARAEAHRADAKAVDPTLGGADADEAAKAAQAAAFAVRRLQAAEIRLTEALEARQVEESEAIKWTAYRDVEKRRDAVAARIAKEYPGLASGMVALIKAALDCAAEVDRINTNLPADAQPMDRPDGKARGFRDNARDGIEGSTYGAIRLAQAVIPDFDQIEWCAWPPNVRTDGMRDNPAATYHGVVERHRNTQNRTAA